MRLYMNKSHIMTNDTVVGFAIYLNYGQIIHERTFNVFQFQM